MKRGLHLQQAKVRRRNIYLLAAGVGLYLFANFQRSSVPGTIFNELQTAFDTTATAVAAVGSMFMYVYALTQLAAGVLADRYGGARTMAVGCGLFCVGSLLFPVSATLRMIYLSRVLIGLGAGVIYLSLVKEVDRIFPDRFASILGIVICLGYSGSIFGGLPLSALVRASGWRTVFLGAAVLMTVCYGVYLRFFRMIRKPAVVSEHFSLKPLLVTVSTRQSLLVILSASCSFGVYYMMLTIVGKKFLEDYCGASATLGSACLSGMVIFSAGGNMLTGLWSSRLGNRRRVFLLAMQWISLSGAALALGGMLLGVRTAGFFIFTMVLFAVSSGFSPITNSLARETNPPEHTGVAVAGMNFAAYAAVAMCGHFGGVLMESFAGDGKVVLEHSVVYPASSYIAVFVLAFLMALPALFTALPVRETNGTKC